MPEAHKPPRHRPVVKPQVARPRTVPTAPSSAAISRKPTEVISTQKHLDLVHVLIVKLTAERDAAHGAGYSTGYLDGYEAGLRAQLADAAAALGIAA